MGILLLWTRSPRFHPISGMSPAAGDGWHFGSRLWYGGSSSRSGAGLVNPQPEGKSQALGSEWREPPESGLLGMHGQW